MRITATVMSLGGGGTERVLATLAEGWAVQGHEVVLVTVGSTADFYATPGVERVGLNLLGCSPDLPSAIRANLSRVRALRRALAASRPDVVLAMGEIMSVLTLIATRGLGVPVVISERTYPPRHHIGPIWERLRRLTYPMADRLVAQTAKAVEWASPMLRSERIDLIPNPLHPRFLAALPEAERERTIVGMGRLVPEKGFADLIDAFALVAPRHPEWRLKLLGEGPERERLEARVRAHGLEARVEFMGLVDAPERVLIRAMVFVLSSWYEGFPNALLEAMACGCAVIATDCETGPADVIAHGRNGLLVPVGEPARLAESIARFIEDDALRRHLGTAAMGVRTQYHPDRVTAEWTSALERA